ncbi:MAG: 1-acyl-sn-glycerol-3-phosphate acyltransferase [Deltaproteobacteria bacterium]|nr:1-acyl-sn-glycerol-3-phosphate acyltransferase [Deltaproteobacteria bacterium]
MRFLKPLSDLVFTLLIWTYYIPGFLLFFSPLYVGALIFSSNRRAAFQRLNSLYYRSFFFVVRALIPGLRISVEDRVRSIHSSVIVCNHLSYLDPILLISLFPRHKTVVKGVFFRVPVFGWILRASGYLPSSNGGAEPSGVLEGIADMESFLSSGGNLFIFPEGTRSRDGRIGQFNHGAFRIARRFGAPLKVLFIGGTNDLLPPGRFLFNTRGRKTVEIRLIGDLKPDYGNEDFSIGRLADQVRSLYREETVAHPLEGFSP